jgi:hypothetical protein
MDLQLPLPTFDDEDDVWMHISTHTMALVCDESDGKVSEFSKKFCSYTGVTATTGCWTSISFPAMIW